jgi:hypothetical protein
MAALLTVFLFCLDNALWKIIIPLPPRGEKDYWVKEICAGAGTGRQVWLRAICPRACGFDSRPAHKKNRRKAVFLYNAIYIVVEEK